MLIAHMGCQQEVLLNFRDIVVILKNHDFSLKKSWKIDENQLKNIKITKIYGQGG